MSENILDIKNLKTYFFTDEATVRAVDGVDLELVKGETLGIVGESGSGKSMMSLSIMGLVPSPPGKIVDGDIHFNGTNLVGLSDSKYRKVRGNEISMIFQEPMTSLNPVFTIGRQLMEVYRYHQDLPRKEARDQSIEMLRMVGISMPEKRMSEYPHQLSGGMRQRVMIAMALACNPKLLIADEPTTALDVTIQAQILSLMRELQAQYHTSIILITHNLGVVAEMADKIMVMYAGKVMEYTDTATIFSDPKHPYTEGLLDSIPRINKPVEKLSAIPGTVPSPQNFPAGCRFHPRCKYAMPICLENEPELIPMADGTQVRCWKYGEEAAYETGTAEG
ncbi:ABC transporter ATP-binding protein [Paenibacillus sp. HN-1]|uniref:ABC transporter ATP-binding protein n=1 Tax=Paenibacillus TaxID=44249 RepID=UPI001CA9987E|nr:MULTISPECIES: ABC transporter ATP-binding protein [Paenibacillus]MBY9078493.1 ABC transporter ATP-binding protein [Paenibacillus sp. CGMCC 1.18879]MBY9082786.1 ABC transporter ATP-binding protein [Paenibacillus sinensis]